MDATALAAALLEPIPANRTMGVKVVRALDASAEVTMFAAPELLNVIGSLHSSGLVALVDAAGLAATIAAATEEGQFEGVVPLGVLAQIEFLAPARGTLTGRCTLAGEDLDALHALLERRTSKAELATAVEVVDEESRVVCRGTFTWKMRRV
jgi:uncharacterized protein (TIGR00369 family)